MHGLHHPFEHGIEKLPRFLRIAVGEQFHGALEVGEEYSDLLALTFNGRLGTEDALGKVLRGVALGRRDTWSRGCRRQSRRMSALRAKLCCRREFAATLCTYPRQRRGALLAELRAHSVYVLAARACHRAPRSSSPESSPGLRGLGDELAFKRHHFGDHATGSEERAVRVGEDDGGVRGSRVRRAETLAEASVRLRIASAGILGQCLVERGGVEYL